MKQCLFQLMTVRGRLWKETATLHFQCGFIGTGGGMGENALVQSERIWIRFYGEK